jgi:hypothetical protein
MRRLGLLAVSAMVVIGLFAATSANAASRRYFVLNASGHAVTFKGATKGKWRLGDEGHTPFGTVLPADKHTGFPPPGNNNALERWSHAYYELSFPFYEAILTFEIGTFEPERNLEVQFQVWNDPTSDNNSRCRLADDGKPRHDWAEWAGGAPECIARQQWLVIYDRTTPGPEIGCLFKPRYEDDKFWKRVCSPEESA